MPIGNAYLPAYHLAKVCYPDQMVTVTGTNYTTTPIGGVASYLATPPALLDASVVYSRYDVRAEEVVAPSELVQAWPESKFFEVGTITYIHEIELPVLLVPSMTGGQTFRIRIEELRFWLSWLTYMFSTFDRATWGNPDAGNVIGEFSAVVDRAGITASVEGLKMTLTIRTNAPMPWSLKLATNKVVGRSATNYDTFVKYEGYMAGDSPGTYDGVGLNDQWGITNLTMEATTSTETIVHTPMGPILTPLNTYLVTDQINAKMVSFTGNLDAFGLVTDQNIGYKHLSSQTSGYYSVGTGSGLSTHDDPLPTQVLPVNVPGQSGGLQIYVGSHVPGVGVIGQAMFLLPTGTLLGRAGVRAAGNGPISVTRGWSGTITNTPRNGGIGGLRARTDSGS